MRRGLVSVLAGAALLAGFLALPAPGDERLEPPAPGFVVRDVRVFDGERVVEQATVVVRDGRVAELGPGLAPPPGLEVVDGRGRTLLPGLIDAHVHPWGDALAETLNFGVTTVLSMFSDPAAARELARTRDSLAPRAHADLFSAGWLATAPGGHGTQFGLPVPTLNTPAEAGAWVDARLAEGSDFIKIVYEPRDAHGLGPPFPSLDRATLAALVQAAHARRRLAVVHVSRLQPAGEALRAGADGLVHVHADHLADAALVSLARERRAFVTPTLAVIAGNDSAEAGQPGPPREAARFAADPAVRPFLSPEQRLGLAAGRGARLSMLRLELALASVRALHEGGVEILAGSDAPNPGTAHGASLHHELELLVRAGLTPVQALRAATAAPAARFALGDRGRIAPGRRADLLLVDGDPTADIRATRAIVRLWKNGAPVPRRRYPEAT
ncbi:amidohydrolase family protein [Rubrivivax sp. JA1026]|uniref:amidohydrolase family protein n=1 Tax=Rubrivivax sp. JA1026 TaxID=2710888 RepID=UPI0013E9149F|nr:amidohydrolase family protein [Rubrivivax sp. JA1026]